MSRALWVYGGGSSADLDAITASASDVLSGKVIVDKEGEPLTGTMPNMGAVSRTLNCGQTYTIPAGYHTGSGKIVANSLASQTSATATAASILKGKTAWVNGSRITGSIPIKDGGFFNPDKGSSKTIITGGTYIANDVVLNPFALPPADKLAKGYTYSLYGYSITGKADVILPQSSYYILKNGYFQNGQSMTHKSSGRDGYYFQYQPDGVTADLHFHSYWGDDESSTATTAGSSCVWLINRPIDITNYNYLYARCDKAMKGRSAFVLGISKVNTCTAWSQVTRYVEAPTYVDYNNRNSDVTLDFSDFAKGSYYFYIGHWGYINFDLYNLILYTNKP